MAKKQKPDTDLDSPSPEDLDLHEIFDKLVRDMEEHKDLLNDPETADRAKALSKQINDLGGAGRLLAYRLGEKYGIDRVTMKTVLPPGYDPKSLRQKSKELLSDLGVEPKEEDLPFSDLTLDEVLTGAAEQLWVEFGAVQNS